MKLKALTRCVVFLFVFITLLAFGAKQSHAATLTSVSDTLTTSRPSPSTPLSADALVGSGQVTVVNNGSTFLASDSAELFVDNTYETQPIATVAAIASTYNVFFTGTTANFHHAGTVLAVPITAMHTAKFTTVTSIPAAGSIQIAFPKSASTDSNQASPSASTFMPNGLASANVVTNQGGISSCSLVAYAAGNAPTVNCNLSATISGNTTIDILIGCKSGSSSCTPSNQVPTLINPTKTAISGLADTWKVNINTYSGASGTGSILDSGSTLAGTIESVNVYAHIDPTFTFQIFGVANGTSMNTVCTSNGTTTQFGTDTTPTAVYLGSLLSTNINYEAQEMKITTNSGTGYTVTATSSGHLINPANGYFIANAQGDPTNNDTPVPVTVSAGSNQFGISPCSKSANTNNLPSAGTWGQGGTPKFANPSNLYYYTLINATSAPLSTGDIFYVEYAATPQGNTPPGDYRTIMTYVASAIF
ncbi:MAG TPA: hypothetical protein VGT05_04430 [Patescibacteria group bacterium]|nr:hypothetical protein [Patescibacteria group bacterium]